MIRINLKPEQAQAVAILSAARQAKADAEKAEKAAADIVKSFLPEGATGYAGDNPVVSRDEVDAVYFDQAVVKARAPRAYALARKPRPYFRINITKGA